LFSSVLFQSGPYLLDSFHIFGHGLADPFAGLERSNLSRHEPSFLRGAGLSVRGLIRVKSHPTHLPVRDVSLLFCWSLGTSWNEAFIPIDAHAIMHSGLTLHGDLEIDCFAIAVTVSKGQSHVEIGHLAVFVSLIRVIDFPHRIVVKIEGKIGRFTIGRTAIEHGLQRAVQIEVSHSVVEIQPQVWTFDLKNSANAWGATRLFFAVRHRALGKDSITCDIFRILLTSSSNRRFGSFLSFDDGFLSGGRLGTGKFSAG